MRSRALPWAVFLTAHSVVAWLGWMYPSQPMGDVVLVYEPWSTAALSGGAVVGITDAWVYPQIALVPLLIAKMLSWPLIAFFGASHAYLIAWAVLVTLIDVIAFAVLLGKGTSNARHNAAWFWCAALVLLGPIALYRLDAITVPLAILGGLWLSTRPVLAAALLTIGAWIKIWPGALVLAAVVAVRRRWTVLVTAGVTAASIVLVLFLVGSDRHLFSFLTQQTGRGLQIEAVAATPFLWLARAGHASVGYSPEILTFQVAATGVDALSALLTPVMVFSVVSITAWAAIKSARGARFSVLFPPLLLALVATLIVTNKVGSPQFQTWLIAPVVLWWVMDRSRAGVVSALVLVLCGLTCLIYPLTYDALLNLEVFPLVLLTLRNVLLVVLLVFALRALHRVPTNRRR